MLGHLLLSPEELLELNDLNIQVDLFSYGIATQSRFVFSLAGWVAKRHNLDVCLRYFEPCDNEFWIGASYPIYIEVHYESFVLPILNPQCLATTTDDDFEIQLGRDYLTKTCSGPLLINGLPEMLLFQP